MTPVSQSSSDVAAAYEKLYLTLKKKLRQQRVKRPSLSLFFGFFFLARIRNASQLQSWHLPPWQGLLPLLPGWQSEQGRG